MNFKRAKVELRILSGNILHIETPDLQSGVLNHTEITSNLFYETSHNLLWMLMFCKEVRCGGLLRQVPPLKRRVSIC